eukprot:scaffold177460_cov21-Tisochrysis_lutea.AAC.1
MYEAAGLPDTAYEKKCTPALHGTGQCCKAIQCMWQTLPMNMHSSTAQHWSMLQSVTVHVADTAYDHAQ